MAHRIRALALALVTLPIVAGCATVVSDQRVSAAPPAAVIAPTPPVPLAGHPPIGASGVVKEFDPVNGILAFEDGRMVKLTGQSKVVQPVGDAVRAGDLVSLQDVLPVGVQSGVKILAMGKPQRMAAVASVDEPSGLVRLTDGSAVRVAGSTSLHLGAAGSSVALTELAPGDELVIVLADAAAAPAAALAPPAPDDSISALPRQDVGPRPLEAAELMVFRAQRRQLLSP